MQSERWQSLSHVWLFVKPWTAARQAPLPMGFSSKNTGVGSHSLFQGIFPTQGSNPSLLHHRRTFTNWATREAGSPLHSLQPGVCEDEGIQTLPRLRWTLLGLRTPSARHQHPEGRLRTFRNASFCSRCLLIMGVTWSVSELGPSLSAPPHQSSSLLYSCSRLSRTLQTCGRKEARAQRGLLTGNGRDDWSWPKHQGHRWTWGFTRAFQNKDKWKGIFLSLSTLL